MKKSNKLSFKKIIIILAFVFLIFNILWYGWRSSKFKDFSQNMEEFDPNTSFVSTDKSGYLYNVKYPDYLSFTGNLAVATPDGKVGLIIWPNIAKGYEFGVQIEDGESYNIKVDSQFKPYNKNFSKIVGKYKDDLNNLVKKAESFWNIELLESANS